MSVVTTLKFADPPLIRWPTAEESAVTHGLIPDFLKAVFFVDENKGACNRPKDKDAQFQR